MFSYCVIYYFLYLNVIKAKAIVLALKLVVQSNARKLIVESDCEPVVKFINNKQSGGSYLGRVVREISSLASLFDTILFQHIFRKVNIAAHTLTSLRSSFLLEYGWGLS